MLVGNMLAPLQVVRTADFLRHGVNNPAMSYGMEDYEAWMRMAASGCLGISIPEILADYRVRKDSMSRVWNRGTEVLLREWMCELNADIYGTWGEELFQLMNANGPGWLWNNGSLSYPQLGYLEGKISPDHLSALRWKFDSEHLAELVKMLEEPAVVWMIQAVVRRRLHRFGVRGAKALRVMRDKFRGVSGDAKAQ
ncbi:MAG TPA: hypothetical protein VIL84_06440 [Devosiaceae bacterium]